MYANGSYPIFHSQSTCRKGKRPYKVCDRLPLFLSCVWLLWRVVSSTDTLVVIGVEMVVTYFRVFFPHSFPVVLEIKGNTKESILHGDGRYVYLKLSKEKKKMAFGAS